MPIELVITYSALFIVFVFFLKQNLSKLRITGAYAGIVFGFIIYYTIIPILIIIFQNEYSLDYRFSFISESIINRNVKDHMFAIITIFIGFIGFHIGYKISFKIKLKNVREVIVNEESKKNKILLIFGYMGYLTLLVGGISFSILIFSLGGIVNTLSVGEQFRGFGDVALSDFVGVNTALLFIPSRLITVTPIIFYFLIINRSRKSDKISFSISFVFSIIFFLFNSGRAPLIIYLIGFVYIFLKSYSKNVWKKLFVLGFIALPLLDILDRVFIYFSTNVWYKVEINYLVYISQFAHPYGSAINLLDMVPSDKYYFGTSIIKDILTALPRVDFEPLFYNVSEYFYGTQWNLIGGVPTDVLTYGYFQMGLIGVVILTLILGYICGLMDKILIKFPKNKSRDFLSVVLATNIVGVVTSADIASLIRGNVVLVSIILILILSSKYLVNLNVKKID